MTAIVIVINFVRHQPSQVSAGCDPTEDHERRPALPARGYHRQHPARRRRQRQQMGGGKETPSSNPDPILFVTMSSSFKNSEPLRLSDTCPH